ncbi:class I SAM-dependent methyltransferase [Bacteroidia bacterium]|nr:class I SAM-dependent methyltransferase [Bacteroidia bacterium]MDB9882326.1 class I SAM-dependent methyltransferase [Bacteroidia bacterium]
MWNERYSSKDYAYGSEPNDYFAICLAKYSPTGKILCAAEGEGRNAVHAAKIGLDAYAFDISEEGKKKALQLSNTHGVSINYAVGDFLQMDFTKNSFDATALIYAHFPPNILSTYHQKIASLIKPNGLVILEGFSTNHLELRNKNPKVGGPKKLEMLFSIESIQKDFKDFEILELEEVEIELNEGLYHNGLGKVIRFVCKKKVS